MGMVFLPCLIALCTIAGIGGGGVVIPFCMMFFVFDTKNAITLSCFSILTNSITRFVLNYRQMHPEKNAVVIDYGLATVMLPTVMMGSYFGVLVNMIVPSLIQHVVLTIMLFILCVQSSLKARQIFNKETVIF